jgi:5'(3')-deoxyribonucleotidase
MADCPVYAGVDPTVLHKPLKTRAFWDSIAPMPGAVAFLEHLARMGIPYNLVTAPANGTSAGAKYDWVKTHFPDALSKLVITSDKASVRGTVLIDDRDKNVVEFFRDNPEARLAIVPRNPYQDESLLDPFPVVYTSRVPNWNGILRVLESER